MKQSHVVFVMLLALLLAVPSVHAEGDIEVVPFDYDFGDVNIGSSIATLVKINNVGDSALTVNAIGFQAGSSTDFAITSTMLLPRTISAGWYFEVEITFAPSAAGLSSATIEITSEDPDEPLVVVALSGTGIGGGTVTPLEQVESILDFMGESIADGSLIGSGPGKSATHRLKALVNMIESARNLIEAELFEEARHKLESAYVHTDGQNRPPDFVVANDAASDLAGQIMELIDSLPSD